MNSDLTFITNEKVQNLKERFEILIKDTKFFDCLLGYFYASGFHANKVLIMDLPTLGALKQYSPIDDPADDGYRHDIFFIRVTDLNENNEHRQKIINEKPAWLEERDDKEGYLRQKALINIYQKFEFEINKPELAYCIINVTDLSASDDEED